ncbi:MAG: helicase [Planctomycetota bacterium]|nr:MAG: helicase [Planctomycetota bacterium]
MHHGGRVAVLLDGESLRKVLKRVLRREPAHADILAEVERIKSSQQCEPFSTYRVYYYTADPITGQKHHPLDGSVLDFSNTDVFRANQALISALELSPQFAVRRGTLLHHGWQIGRKATTELQRGRKSTIEARDIIPRIEQKGVDMRIGLDIASLALTRIVEAIVVVTGDADLVPAMKLARREGLQVFLDTVGHTAGRRELRAHADGVLKRDAENVGPS